MKSKLGLFLTLFFLSFSSFSQITIKGRIADAETGNSLPNAAVVLENTFYLITSNEDGNFTLNKVKKGKYTLKVSYIGYKTYQEEIDAGSDMNLTVKLAPQVLVTDEVIIISTRVGDRVPATVRNIDKKDIRQINLGCDLPYIINYTPSAVVTSDAGTGVGYTGLRIRGSDLTRINVTMNGVPVNDPESQMVYFVDLPDFASSVDNIQIQRGVGTSSNGAASFGASINIQTLKLNPEPYLESNNSYGSFNTWKNNMLFGTGLINGKWVFDGRLSRVTSDGYIDRAWSDLKSFYISVGYYAKRSMLRFNILSGKEKTYQAWYGVPADSLKTHRTYNPYSYPGQVDDYKQDYYQLIYSVDLLRNLNLNTAAFLTKGKGYYEEYKDSALFSDYNIENPIINGDTIKNTALVRRRWLDNYFYGLNFSLNYDNHKNLQAFLGGAWNKYNCDHYGEVIQATNAPDLLSGQRYYENNGNKRDFNLYFKVIYTLAKKINLFADMQYRSIRYSFTGYDESLNSVRQTAVLNFFNPKAGVSYDINASHHIYLVYGMGNKEPNRDDYTTSVPSSRPKHESLHDIELGYHLTRSNVKLNINGFYMYYKNQLVLTGKINQNSEYVRINVPESYRLGIELDGSVVISRYLKIAADFSYSRNKINSFTEYIDDNDTWIQHSIAHKNTDISFSPAIITSAIIDFMPFLNTTIEWRSKYVGKQYLDNTSDNNRMLKGYFVNSLRFSYLLKLKLIKEIELNVMINNLFNSLYSSNGWTYPYYLGGTLVNDNYYYPQAGANFMAGLRLKL